MAAFITVPFYGNDLLAITTATDTLVPLPPLVDGMGIDWSSQLKRVKRDPILGSSMVMMTMESGRTAQCLPLDLVPGFLFKVDASRVAAAVRPKVLAYQRECFRVLANACLGKVRSTTEKIAEIPLTEIQGEPRARDLDIAERLGFDRPRDIRKLIERHAAELATFGVCATVAQNHGGGRGRPSTEFWLNEEQALLIATVSSATNAPAVNAARDQGLQEAEHDEG